MISPLAVLFLVKIGVTGLGVALPLLILPTTRLSALTGLPDGRALWRLYGVAILALLVGYVTALPTILAGEAPTGMLWVASVSNMGAACVLALGTAGPLRLSAIFFALIGGGAVLSLIAPSVML